MSPLIHYGKSIDIIKIGCLIKNFKPLWYNAEIKPVRCLQSSGGGTVIISVKQKKTELKFAALPSFVFMSKQTGLNLQLKNRVTATNLPLLYPF